jgi:hypothetical protein
MNPRGPLLVLLAWLAGFASTGAGLRGAGANLAPAEDLAAGFQSPPAAAKPRTLWHWISGNVSKAGITADLEAMQRIGVGGAMIVCVYREVPRGPASYLSATWRELVQHAIAESNRLGLELTLANSEGWSESGGPWVTPAESMQQLVWSESRRAGGRRVPLTDLPEPGQARGHYRDVAVLAFPSLPDDEELRPRNITASHSTAPGDTAHLAVLPLPKAKEPEWLQLDFGAPVACSSIRIESEPMQRLLGLQATWQLQCSDDGVDFRPVGPVATLGTTVFAVMRARYFRLWIENAPSRTPNLAFTKVALAGPRLAQLNALSGLTSSGLPWRFGDNPFPAERIIAASSVRDLTGLKEWDAPPGDWTVLRFGHTSTGRLNHPVDPRTAGLECDKLSRAAVEAHFRHGPIAAALADAAAAGHADRRFQFIFLDSWEAGGANWTPLMREEFRRRRGYDPLTWLPVLTGRVIESIEASERFGWDFRRTIADLVADKHYGTFRELAAAHGLGVYAEAVGAGTRTVADQLQSKGRVTIPMAEFWVNGRPSDDTKEAASAAHIHGQNIAAAEAFTAAAAHANWTNDPASLKATGDAQFCRGINRIVFHRYAHQPWLDRAPGMTLGFWGIQFERTNTWWEPGAAWMDYLARCQFMLQRGQFVADLCYFYGEGAPASLNSATLDPAPPRGYDFDACDAETLQRMTVRDGRLVLPGGMSYRALVLPRSDRMSLPMLRHLRELVRAGATVIGPRPAKSPSLADGPTADATLEAIARELWGDDSTPRGTAHAFGTGRIGENLPLASALGVPPDFACDAAALQFIHRRDGDTDLYFLSNQSPAAVAAQCTFRVAGRAPELWHADTGARETLAAYEEHDGRTTLRLALEAAGSVFVVFRAPASGFDPIVGERLAGDFETLVREGDGAVLRSEHAGPRTFVSARGKRFGAAVPRLPAPLEIGGPWSLRVPAKPGAAVVLTLPQLTSWTDTADEAVKYFSGTATYTRSIHVPPDFLGAGKRVWLDLGVVKNLARVALNGRALGTLWKPPFRVDITAAAQPGENRLELQVTNLWPNRLIGDQRLPEAQRTTWTTWQPYRADSPLLPSGLLGPVVVRAVAEVPVLPTPGP